MLSLQIAKACEKFLKTLPPKHKRQVALKIVELREKDGDIPDTTSLKGFTFKKVDIGEYRIIYEIEGETLSILLVRKRNDSEVYKKLSRKF